MDRGDRGRKSLRSAVAALGVLAAAAAVGVVPSGSGVAEAATSLVPGLTYPLVTADHTVAGVADLLGVACETATTCLAVGASSSGVGVVVPVVEGVPGTPEPVAGTTGLSSVACGGSSHCLAANTNGQAVPVTGVTPGALQAVPAGVTGAACPTATQCILVGTTSSFVPFVDVVTNGTAVVTYPSGSGVANGLGSVTCQSASTCVAAGESLGCAIATMCPPQPFVVSITNGVVTVVPSSPLPTGVVCQYSQVTGSGGTGSVLSSCGTTGPIQFGGTCTSTAVCLTVQAGGGTVGLMTESGSEYTEVTAPGPPTLDGDGCGSQTSCLVVGEDASTSTAVVDAVALERWTGPPATQVLLPSGGATVRSGTWLDASASSAVGVSSVTFLLSGGGLSDKVIATAQPTIDGWIGGFDFSTVTNGTYTLQSEAVDALGASTLSAPVTVTVDNLPLATAVLLPSAGSTLTLGSTEVMDASASGPAPVTGVRFELTPAAGGTPTVVATATLTAYGWIAYVPSSIPLSGRSFELQSVATQSGGTTATSPPVAVTVAAPVAG